MPVGGADCSSADLRRPPNILDCLYQHNQCGTVLYEPFGGFSFLN